MERMKMNDLKPLTQAEIDAVPDGILEGWTVKSDGWLHDEPDSYLGRNQANAITKLVRKLLSAEQEERLSGVWIDGQWREIIVAKYCPNCNEAHWGKADNPCKWDCIGLPGSVRLWLAPAPAPKEPEMDEFEKCVMTEIQNIDRRGETSESDRVCFEQCLEMYQQIVTRKGEQDGK